MRRLLAAALIAAGSLTIPIATDAVTKPAVDAATPTCSMAFLYYNSHAVGGRARCINTWRHYVVVGCGNGVTLKTTVNGPLAAAGTWSARQCPSWAPLAHWVSRKYVA